MPAEPDESPESISVEPIPVEPIPVEPIPIEASAVEASAVEPLEVEPLPVEPLPVVSLPAEPLVPPPRYSQQDRVGPPRMVAAIGAWSIVVAAIALIGGPISALIMAGIVGIHTGRAAAIAAQSAPPQIVSVAEMVDPNGFAAADRMAIVDGLSRVRSMTPGQQLQLDELVAESGRDIIKLGSPIDPAVVAASVNGNGQLGTLGMAGTEVGGAPIYFVLAEGRLELTDHRAVYFPGDGQPALRAIAYDLPPLSSDPATAAPALGDEAIRSTLRNIARLNVGKPKSAQVQALLTLLRGSNQQVIVPMTDGKDPAAEVVSASTDAEGTLNITTSHGGSICRVNISPSGQLSASVAPVIAAPTGPAAGSLPLGVVLIAGAVELLIAIYLLIAGILTVRRAHAGAVLHWIYVAVKIPTTVAAIIAAVWLGRSLAVGGNPIWWATPAAVGLIYPVALIFALCTRSVRAYYAPSEITGSITSAGTRSAPW